MPKIVNKNMHLWECVETTDPAYTKKVNQRGGFTAIGAQYQLKTATSVFGPFGQGWGVKDEEIEKWEDVGIVVYHATLWYVRYSDVDEEVQGHVCQFPIHSSIKYHNKGRVDDDFMKKVATDALTKGLSKLGFNADVFMGKFDDNKYVNKLTDMSGTWKNKVIESMEGLNDDDKKAISEYIKEGRINFKNHEKALKRIESLKLSYETDDS